MHVEVEDGATRWGWEPIRTDDMYSYGVRRWPFVLFETIYQALGLPADDDYNIAIKVIVRQAGNRRTYFKHLRYADLRDIAAIEAAAKEEP